MDAIYCFGPATCTWMPFQLILFSSYFVLNFPCMFIIIFHLLLVYLHLLMPLTFVFGSSLTYLLSDIKGSLLQDNVQGNLFKIFSCGDKFLSSNNGLLQLTFHSTVAVSFLLGNNLF